MKCFGPGLLKLADGEGDVRPGPLRKVVEGGYDGAVASGLLLEQHFFLLGLGAIVLGEDSVGCDWSNFGVAILHVGLLGDDVDCTSTCLVKGGSAPLAVSFESNAQDVDAIVAGDGVKGQVFLQVLDNGLSFRNTRFRTKEVI